MAVQSIPSAVEDEVAGPALVAAAAAELERRQPGIPADFVTALFGQAVPEDLDRYRPDELAAIAERSWSFIRERRPGAAKIRFEAAAAPPGVAILEILND